MAAVTAQARSELSASVAAIGLRPVQAGRRRPVQPARGSGVLAVAQGGAAGTVAAVAGLVALAAGYAGAALHVVLGMRIGPTVATLAPGRGLHSGDVLALPLLLCAMACLAAAVGCWSRHEARTRAVRR